MHKIAPKKLTILPVSFQQSKVLTLDNKIFVAPSKQLPRGMVLITTLLILLVISLLATSLLKTSLMAKKINTLNQNKIKAFNLAINKLQILELNPTNKPHEDNIEQVATNIEAMDSGVCGVDFYKIGVIAKYAGITSEIQSIWAQPNNHYSTCEVKIRPGRQSFLIIR